MSLFAYIDIYCERLDAGLFAEPVNAVSNASFFIAAWLLFRQYKAGGGKDLPAALLILLVGLVGAGSLSFHLFANRLAMLADVIPIGLFVFYYLWVALRRLFLFSGFKAALALLGFAALFALTGQIPPPWRFNGSVGYLPCLAAAAMLALPLRGHPSARPLWQAAACFVLSLVFRSMDMAVCPLLGIGTHFLWHLLNGVVLYLLVKAVISPLRGSGNRVN